MRGKHLIILVVVLVVVAALAYVVKEYGESAWSSTAAGDRIFPDFPPTAEVSSVVLKKGTQKATVKRQDGNWQVEQRYGYPAAPKQLQRFILDTEQLRVTQLREIAEEDYDRVQLSLEENAARSGLKVLFKNNEGKTLRSMVLGADVKKEARRGRSYAAGRFIRVPRSAGDLVAVVDKPFGSIKADPVKWLDDTFIEISKVQKAWLTVDGRKKWTLQRNDEGDLKLAGFSETDTKKLDKDSIRDVSNAFRYADFEDVADPDLPPGKTGLNKAKMFTAIGKDDIKYTVKIGKREKSGSGPYYVKVAAQYIGPDEPKTNKQEGGEKPSSTKKETQKQKQKIAERKSRAKRIHEDLNKWVYLLPADTVESVIKERSAFITVKKEDKEEKDKGAKPGPKTKAVPRITQ